MPEPDGAAADGIERRESRASEQRKKRNPMESSERFEEIQIPLLESVHGLGHVRGVLGTPEWWPTGERVAVVVAHGSSKSCDDPLIEHLTRALTARGILTLRFDFPFAEAGKRATSDSPVVLERTFKAAVALLGRDPSALPARLFVGGVGLGGRVAAELAAERLHADGLFLLGFPLHVQDKPEKVDPDVLYRVTSPMLFVQGTRDRRCQGEALRRVLRRVGAPIELHDVEHADSNFHAPKKSGRRPAEVHAEILGVLSGWIARRLR
mgnify:CR=1 FL=1